MRLNIDCVRDVMLWAEANSDLRHPAIYKVKKVLNMLGVKSLEAAMQASSLVISNLIKSAIG